MIKLIIIFCLIFISYGNTTSKKKIKDVCQFHHREIIGWHENYKLFQKRHIELSDKSKYPDNNDKTIEKYLMKQKKLVEAIDVADKKLQSLSKVYHYLECTRFEKQFERD